MTKPAARSGRERYEAARSRQGARPADPLHLTGQAPDRTAIDALNEPCVCEPGTGIPHTSAYHHQARPGGPVTYCTRMTSAGPCGCKRFRPASTTLTGESTPDDGQPAGH